MEKAKILVFDTGAGGRAFADFLGQKSQDYQIDTLIDAKNSPYGPRGDREIIQLVEAILSPHIGHYDAIVLACNTATAVAIDSLRLAHPEQIFIGFEPMIKTAAGLTKTGTIAVLATAATKNSERYQALKRQFPELTIIEPDCNGWAKAIDDGLFTEAYARAQLDGELAAADVVVLGCTHYVTQKDLIQKIVGPEVQVVEPFSEVATHIAVALGTPKC